MKKTLWVVIGIVSLLFVFAIIFFFNFGISNISEIIKNPENYFNKKVTVVGNISVDLLGGFILTDDQGYVIYLDKKACTESQRVYLPGKYIATGFIYETCNCQSRLVVNITKDMWDKLRFQHPKLPEENISTNMLAGIEVDPPYLILPAPEYGWSLVLPFFGPETRVSECKTSLYAQNENITVKYSWEEEEYYPGFVAPFFTSKTDTVTFRANVIKEERCVPNSIKIYLQCTEPLVKI
jgi:hypothetical protein